MSIGRVPGVTGIQPSIVDAKGDLIVATAADSVDRLAVGSANQVLTVDSSTATGLKWAAPSAGGLTLLQTMTLSGSSTTSSTIAGTYKNLLIFVKGAYASTDSDFNMRFNSDTGANYGRFRIRNSDSSVSGTSQNAQTLIELSSLKNSTTATDQVYGVVNVYRYADTDISYFDFTFYSRWSNQLNQYVGNGYYDQSAAISTVTFIPGSGTFSGGSVYIYGVS